MTGLRHPPGQYYGNEIAVLLLDPANNFDYGAV